MSNEPSHLGRSEASPIRPEPGQVWRNKHTGKWAKVYAIEQEARTRPTRLAQAPDGRLIMYDHEPYTAPMVRFEGGAPPGFDDRTQGGWELEQWLEHWQLDDFPGAV